MPKGKGAAGVGGIQGALDTDLASREEQRAPEPSTSVAIRRVNITIAEDVLRATDREVFERKQSGDSGASRSQHIAEALRQYLERVE